MPQTSPWMELLLLVGLVLALGIVTGLATRDRDQRHPQPR